MNEPSLLDNLSEEAVWRLEDVCCRFEQSWPAGSAPRPEDFLNGAEGAERLAVVRELVRLDVYYRRQTGEEPAVRDYATRFPDAIAALRKVFPNCPAGGMPSHAPDPEATGPDLDRTGPDVDRTGPYIEAVNSRQRDELAGQHRDPSMSRYLIMRLHAAGGLPPAARSVRQCWARRWERRRSCHRSRRPGRSITSARRAKSTASAPRSTTS